MNLSSSVDFSEMDRPRSELIEEASDQDKGNWKVKFRVPSTPALATENIVAILRPYEYLIEQAQAILFWHRPLQFVLLMAGVESFFFVVWKFDLGFLSGAVILFTVGVTGVMVIENLADMEHYFPPITAEDGDGEPHRHKIYSIEDLADFLSVVGSRLHCFVLGCVQKARDPTVVGQTIWLSFLVCCFVATCVMRTFYIFVVVVNLILIVPGIVFHPDIYGDVAPSLNHLMMAIAPKVRERQD